MCIPTPFAAHGRYSQHPFLGNTLTSQRPHSNQSLSSSKAVVLKCCQETRKSESPKSGPEGPGSPSPCHGRSPALDVDIAAFSIPQTDGEPVSNEAIFQHGGISAYATFNSAFALVDHLPSRSAKDAFLASLRASESFNTSGAQYSGTSAGQQVSVDARLCDALQQAKAGVATSALLVEFSNSNSTIMRASWAGVVGLIVVRDGEIVFRTHETREARDGLENMLNVKIAEAGNQRDVSASPPLVPGLSSASCQGRSTIDSRMSTVVWGSDGQALDAHRPTCGIAMQSSFFELRDGDLILGGSQTFFANLSEVSRLCIHFHPWE